MKTERQPEKLGSRILAAKSDLEGKLGATASAEALQTTWSALLHVLAEGAYWQIGNQALSTSRTFDFSQSQLLLRDAGRVAAETHACRRTPTP